MFEKALEEGQIVEAVIHQNAQVPTGQVVILLQSGNQEAFTSAT